MTALALNQYMRLRELEAFTTEKIKEAQLFLKLSGNVKPPKQTLELHAFDRDVSFHTLKDLSPETAIVVHCGLFSMNSATSRPMVASSELVFFVRPNKIGLMFKFSPDADEWDI